MLALVLIGAGIYVLRAIEIEHSAELAQRRADRAAAAKQREEEQSLLAKVKREEQRLEAQRERVEKANDDTEFRELNAEMDKRVRQNERQEEQTQVRQQTQQAAQQAEWQKELDDAIKRRQAWEKCNASNDAVAEVHAEEQGRPPPSDYVDCDSLLKNE